MQRLCLEAAMLELAAELQYKEGLRAYFIAHPRCETAADLPPLFRQRVRNVTGDATLRTVTPRRRRLRAT